MSSGNDRGNDKQNSDAQDLLDGDVLLRDLRDNESFVEVKVGDAVVDDEKRRRGAMVEEEKSNG